MGADRTGRYDVVVTHSADLDLGEIFEYVAIRLQVPETAAKLVDRLYGALEPLADMPYRYPLSRDAFLAKQGFRVIVVGNYLVFYVIDEAEKKVIVHRALYGKRNYRTLFASDIGT